MTSVKAKKVKTSKTLRKWHSLRQWCTVLLLRTINLCILVWLNFWNYIQIVKVAKRLQIDCTEIFIWLSQISSVTAGIELARDLVNRNLENFLLDLEHPETNLKGENPQESNLKSLSPLRYESMNILYLQESMTTC